MTSPPSRRDAAATRQRLLRVSLELFATAGYRGTTTPMIAERAGVAEGTIYRHFSGKEALLNEVYRESQRWAAGVVSEAAGAERSARAQEILRRLGRRLLEAAQRDPAALRMALDGTLAAHLDARSREAAGEFRAALQRIVASGKSDGLIRSGPAELWADLWLELVRFAAERVATGEWAADQLQATLTLDAAWDAIAVRGEARRPTPD